MFRAMAEAMPTAERSYPRTVGLGNGQSVTLREMGAGDAERVLAFARSLPPDDLLFLRTDITDPAVIAQWVTNVASGRTITILAEASGAVVGYASLHKDEVTWQRHLGEMRIQVAPHLRAQGLGRALAGEVFALARDTGLRKVFVQMTEEQRSARALVERLGFTIEALLQDFVVDRSGRTHDVVLMSYDVGGHTQHVD
jgi:L-amino acid N-acyltransferase YncA